VFLRLLGFLYGVLGSVFAGLACACMLFSVKFHVVMREVRMLRVRFAGKQFSEEERSCMDVVVRVFRVTSTLRRLCWLGFWVSICRIVLKVVGSHWGRLCLLSSKP
jgi:hypothetical protein